MDLLLIIAAIVAGSLLSLAGGILLLRTKKLRERAVTYTLPLAAGALLAAAFFDLLPESVEHGDARVIFMYALAGFLAFFVLERLGSWFHHHHAHNEKKQQRAMVVVGDLVHNIIDGIAIGAAFLVSVPTGIITTIAVSAHEIPKEIGTFALLLSKGWRGRKVVIANVLTAVGTVVAGVATYLLGHDIFEGIHAPLLAITAGFFIYIAASDVIPDIHQQPRKIGRVQALILLASVVLVGWLTTLLHA